VGQKKKSEESITMIMPENINDVFFARGHGVDENPGNIRYRKLISNYGQIYKKTSGEKERTEVANTIISAIRSQGGRFYSHPKGSEGYEWTQVSNRFLMRTVIQALRDYAFISRSSNELSVSPKQTSTQNFARRILDNSSRTLDLSDENISDNDVKEIADAHTSFDPERDIWSAIGRGGKGQEHYNNIIKRMIPFYSIMKTQEKKTRIVDVIYRQVVIIEERKFYRKEKTLNEKEIKEKIRQALRPNKEQRAKAFENFKENPAWKDDDDRLKAAKEVLNCIVSEQSASEIGGGILDLLRE